MTDVKRIPHASHWGAYYLIVEDGRIVGAEPFEKDPSPSPLIHSVAEWANPRRRIPAPMIRRGWLADRERSDGSRRGSDTFVQVPWDEALDLVSGEIRRVIDTLGNSSIFAGSYGWTSSGRFHHAATLMKRMLNLVGGYTDHVDTYSMAAGPVILRHTLGSDEACYARSSTMDTVVAHTETLVVFGSLSPRTAQTEAGGLSEHMLEDTLRALVAKGTKIVLVSPQRSDLPDWVPCDWWPIRPNTDTALMLALAHEIVVAGDEDRAFLKSHCSGADRFLAYLAGDPDGTPRSAEWASGITGLDAGKIRSLAARLPKTRSMVTVSWSLQRAQHGEQPFWAALGLAAVTGQIGLPGGGVAYGYGSSGGSGAPIGLGRSPGMSKGKNPTGSFIPVARIADMLLTPGAPYTYEGETRHYPDARLVYWAGGNPFHHHQDLNRLQSAWARPETIIVQDPVWTATAQRADIVLPVATSVERNDIAANQRTNRYAAMKRAIAPVGQARSDFDIYAGLAERLGVAEAFTENRDEMGWLRTLYEKSRSAAREQEGFEMVDFDTFWADGHALVPTKRNYTYLADYRAAPDQHPLNTESGRIVLGSEQLAGLGHADCGPHPQWFPPSEWLGAAEAGERLHLLSNQPEGRLHSQLPDGPASRQHKREGREVLRLHPDDASRRGIAEGTRVRLSTARGACLAVARLDARVSRGVAVLPTGAWFSPDAEDGTEVAGNPNVLTADLPSSAFGQGCAANTCLVQIEPTDEDAAGADEAFAQFLSRST